MQETERGSCCGGFLWGTFFQIFMDLGMMGPAMSRFNKIMQRVAGTYLTPTMFEYIWRLSTMEKKVSREEKFLRQRSEYSDRSKFEDNLII